MKIRVNSRELREAIIEKGLSVREAQIRLRTTNTQMARLIGDKEPDPLIQMRTVKKLRRLFGDKVTYKVDD